MDLVLAVAAACVLAKPKSRVQPERPNDPGIKTEPSPMEVPPEPVPFAAPVKGAEAAEFAGHRSFAGPIPEVHLCLVHLPGQGSARRQMAALAGSMLVHGALLVAVMNGGRQEIPRAEPRYRLQVLHLQPPKPSDIVGGASARELWNALHPASVHESSAGQAAGGSAGPSGGSSRGGQRKKSPAPQTLIVESAPPELKLNQAIPLPLAVSWTAVQPLPPKQEQVRLDSPQAPVPETVRPPEVKVIAVPEPFQRADAVTIPKVIQSAAQDFQGRDFQGKDSQGKDSQGKDSANKDSAGVAANHVATVDAGAAAAADEAARARAAAENEARARAALEGAAKGAAANSNASGVSSVPAVSSGSPPGLAGAGLAATGQQTTGQQAAADKGPVDAGLVRIDQPPGGRARSAILGESPHMPGRIVSTIYLRMNLRKNWALEFWSQGSTAVLAAPWPYTMFRPNFTLPADADALLVRGRLTAEGRLEQLAMLAPAEWAQKDSLFRALEQWKFRAATKNGEAVPVDVLLVIPRQPEE